ncbi:MAG: T9SS type A sorting domain-containing protein [Methanomicrobiales archaeon]
MTGSGADENKRRPMQWSPDTYAGFSTHVPWIGIGNNYVTNNVATMSQDQGSLLVHYKKLIRIRNEHAALRRGYFLNVKSTDANILSYARIYEDNAIVVMSNFGSLPSNAAISLPISSLSAGTYYVTELYNGISMGTLTIDSNGGFSDWHSTDNSLADRDTWILLVSRNPGSVSEISSDVMSMSLYPNPATLQVRVELNRPLQGNGLAEVYNSTGSCIYQKQFAGEKTIIPTGGLSAGVYFVKVSCGSKSRICPLVVNK